MSDYLGNLAAKSLAPGQPAHGEGLAVLPRLASRFEPVAPELQEGQLQDGPGFVETVEGLFPERVSRRSGETSPPVPLSRRPPPDRERGNVEPASRVEPKPFQSPLTLPPPVRQDPSATSPLALSGEGRREREPRGEVRQDAPVTSPLSRSEGGRWERGTGGEVRQDVPFTPPLSRLEEGRREREPGGEVRRDSPFTPPLSRLKEERREKETRGEVQPRITILERDPFPVRSEPPAAQPVIHVTIGRIEVRAAPAPKAPARERPAARAAVDLEEYLRQRSRGEGR